jgi:hypothetical protein
LDKKLRKILGQKPTTAKEAVSAIDSVKDGLGESEFKVQFHEIDEFGFTISLDDNGTQSLKVQIWADESMDDLLHLACPLIELKKLNLNTSAILRQPTLFSFLTDRQGKELALVHTLNTKAGFPLETVISIAWALAAYAQPASKYLKEEKA